MEQLQKHYRLTFHVWFQDGISPELYGTLYYQNRRENKYCMALPDGNFAVFADSRVGRKPNISHEVCYPIKDCLNNPGFLSAAPGR
jgi:tRNA U34 5-methylaminomethyl-2-thiouridine-forming methyltransferase MnmC